MGLQPYKTILLLLLIVVLQKCSKDHVMHLISTWPLISVLLSKICLSNASEPPPWCGRKATGLRGRGPEFQTITKQCWDPGKSVNFSCLAFLICTKR